MLAAFLGPMEGVARVIEPGEYAKWGYPPPTRNGRMADLVLAATPDYAFDGAIEGEPVSDARTPGGTHGYLNTDPDMNAILVAWGAGIRQSKRARNRTSIWRRRLRDCSASSSHGSCGR